MSFNRSPTGDEVVNDDTITMRRQFGRTRRRSEPSKSSYSFDFASCLPSSPLIILLVLCAIFQPCSPIKELRCGPIDIRNKPWSFKQQYSRIGDPHQVHLGNKSVVDCTVVEGSFTISFIYDYPSNHEMYGRIITQADYPVFPNLREITGALLVFETNHLENLSAVFPNLRVIGGQTLIQHFALIIYRNNDLHTLGLDKLAVVRNGGIRIQDNKYLCAAKTIEWKNMIMSHINDVMIDEAAELAVAETGLVCERRNCEADPDLTKCRYLESAHHDRIQSCWTNHTCQRACDHEMKNGVMVGPGCDLNGQRCHEQCLGGCDRINDAAACSACKHVHYKGKCVEKCPAHLFTLMNRRCVTREECFALNPVLNNKTVGIKAINGICSDKCPEGWEQDPNDIHACKKCVGKCVVTCELAHTIDSFPKALLLKRCNIIKGNLVLEIRGKEDSGMAQELKEVFKEIHTITGHLSVQRSPPFLTMAMFKSLKLIKGEELVHGEYSLVIVENHNLRQLFEGRNFTLARGTAQIHNNRMLCFKHVRSFMQMLGKPVDPISQSPSSNGDKAICEDEKLYVNVTMIGPDTIQFEWKPFNTTNMDQRKFLGYELYYKQVDKIDYKMSIDDDRSACVDSWTSVFKQFIERDDMVQPEKVEMTLGPAHRIRPNTLYAYYVATQMVIHAGARNGLSSIGFVRTHYSIPEAPIIQTVKSSEHTITIGWTPPHLPNGVITHYQISWRELETNVEQLAESFCKDATSKNDETVNAFKLGLEDTGPEQSSVTVSTPKKTAEEGTCSAFENCCECSAVSDKVPMELKLDAADVAEQNAAFENAVLDAAIMPREQIRARRSIQNANRVNEMIEKDEKAEKEAAGKKKNKLIHVETKKPKTATQSTPITDILIPTENPYRVFGGMVPKNWTMNTIRHIPKANNDTTGIKDNLYGINITAKETGNTYTITGLKHFTHYGIAVVACQNITEDKNYCSPLYKHGMKRQTDHLKNIDKVSESSIRAEPGNTTGSIVVRWDDVTESNGGIRGYEVMVKNVDTGLSPTRCRGAFGNWNASTDGVVFSGLPGGEYIVRIVATSLRGAGVEVQSPQNVFVFVPGFFTIERVAIILFVIIVLCCLIAGAVYYYVQVHYGRKVKALADFMHLNPEYCVDDRYLADDWELDKDLVTMGDLCGEGSFGKVYLGTGKDVLSLYGCRFGPCAIKINHGEGGAKVDQENQMNYLMEANIMKNFKTHFIVKLYGVISTYDPAWVVMEMMDLGNLRDYLRAKREDDVFNEMDCDFFDIVPREKFSEWAAQISDGMAYLESLKFCHRDLAARNCMIDAHEVCKIGDFGMARDLFYHDYYKPSGKRMMPVRWMSPESLKDGKFDSKSDVWSFGVVLYEMVTLGAQPYIGLSNDEVLNYIGMARKVIKKPECCSDYWYKVMKMCWRYSPRDRPTFLQLVHLLSAEASAEFKEKSFVLTENQMAMEDTEPLDLDVVDIWGDEPETVKTEEGHDSEAVTEEGEEPGKRRMTDSIPMKTFNHKSPSTLSVDAPGGGVRPQRSVDDEYALMTHSRGPSDTEIPRTYADGDYVERDVQNDIPTRRNTGASNVSYTGGPYCLSNRGGSNERAIGGFGEGVRLTDGIGSGHLDDNDYVEKDLSSMDTRRSTGASTSSYNMQQQQPTNWSGNRGATFYAAKKQEAAEKAAAQQQANVALLNGGRGDRLTQLPGTGHLPNRGRDEDYIETSPRNNGRVNGSPSRNGNSGPNRGSFNGRSGFGESERLIEDTESHPLQ